MNMHTWCRHFCNRRWRVHSSSTGTWSCLGQDM
jgi:hypothetical protein